MSNLTDQNLSDLPALKWLPWIGGHYLDREETSRILIVGESHYRGDTPAEIETAGLDTFTRVVVEEMAYKGQKYPTFSNLLRVLFKNADVNRNSFWNAVAFLNFVQTPMHTKTERPSYKHYYDGWKNFFEIVKILKPTTCIFIGTTAANSFTNAIENTGFSSDGIKTEDKIGAYAKVTVINDGGNIQTKIVFIRHTGKYCSWSKWHEYLKKTIPSELSWLEKQIAN